jgi:hypothetical protein
MYMSNEETKKTLVANYSHDPLPPILFILKKLETLL